MYRLGNKQIPTHYDQVKAKGELTSIWEINLIAMNLKFNRRCKPFYKPPEIYSQCIFCSRENLNLLESLKQLMIFKKLITALSHLKQMRINVYIFKDQ